MTTVILAKDNVVVVDGVPVQVGVVEVSAAAAAALIGVAAAALIGAAVVAIGGKSKVWPALSLICVKPAYPR